MTKGFYNLTSGMLSQTRRLDVVGNNMTNVSTPGFKSEIYTDSTFEEVMWSRIGNNERPEDVGTQSYILAASELHINHEAGFTELTGLNLDFAIIGDGYFGIQKENGVEYTRGGSFSLDGEGYLYLAGQGRVLDSDGQPILLATDKISADQSGRITLAETGEEVAQLGVFTFATDDEEAEPVGLIKNESGLFTAEPPEEEGQEAIDPTQMESPTVMWKAVENSNVEMVDEMVRMMTAQRALQSAGQVLKLYDGILTKSTTDLGRV